MFNIYMQPSDVLSLTNFTITYVVALETGSSLESRGANIASNKILAGREWKFTSKTLVYVSGQNSNFFSKETMK